MPDSKSPDQHGLTSTPPKTSPELQVSFPAAHVLLLTLNRPEARNAMTPALVRDLHAMLNWMDEEPGVWVTIVTGAGRAFCAGADLKAWGAEQQRGTSNEQEGTAASIHGFGSLSRRATSSKPLIAAVNGGAYGGGVEILLNCDLVIASEDAMLALPEVKRGVSAAQGGIPRLVQTAGRQLASELLLLGRPVTAHEACTRFGFVNKVAPKGEALAHAINWAREIVNNSPDAVQSTKRAVVISLQHGNVEQATVANAWSAEARRLYKGDNIKEGLKAFAEKRKPVWMNPAKL